MSAQLEFSPDWAFRRAACVADGHVACGVPYHQELAGPGGMSYLLLPYEDQPAADIEAAEALIRSKYDVVRLGVKHLDSHALSAADMPYLLLLAARGNPDHGQDPDMPPWGVPGDRIARVGSMESAAGAVRAYIRTHDLGCGNWVGGDVWHAGAWKGKFSYNGRFWESGHEFAKPCVEFRERMEGALLKINDETIDPETMNIVPEFSLQAFTAVRSPEAWRAWFASEVERTPTLRAHVFTPSLDPVPCTIDADGDFHDVLTPKGEHAIGAAFTRGDATIRVATFAHLAPRLQP